MVKGYTQILLSFLMALLPTTHAWAQKLGTEKNSEPVSQTISADLALVLNLKPSTSVFYIGEPFFISFYLENVSDKTYLIGRDLHPNIWLASLHYVELRVVDAKGQKVANTIFYAHIDPDATIAEKVKGHYIPLSSGMMYGRKVGGDMNLAPGRYTYTAIYREIEATKWTAEQKAEIPYPVWTRQLISAPLTITVRKRK